MKPRYFFFGLYRVERYEWLYGHTAAQIELMSYDTPVTVYKADSTGKPKPGEKGFERTAEQAANAYQRWLDRKNAEKKKGMKVDLDSFLGGAKDGGEEQSAHT